MQVIKMLVSTSFYLPFRCKSNVSLSSSFPGRPGRQMSGERKGGHIPELQAYPRLLEPPNGDLIGNGNRG